LHARGGRPFVGYSKRKNSPSKREKRRSFFVGVFFCLSETAHSKKKKKERSPAHEKFRQANKFQSEIFPGKKEKVSFGLPAWKVKKNGRTASLLLAQHKPLEAAEKKNPTKG